MAEKEIFRDRSCIGLNKKESEERERESCPLGELRFVWARMSEYSMAILSEAIIRLLAR